MALNRSYNSGPIQLTTTLTTNVLNPPTVTGGLNIGGAANCYFLIKHWRVVNRTAAAVTCSFWLGATGANAAGTEVIGQALSVPANSFLEGFTYLRIDVSQFLVGGASALSSLTIEFEGEIGIV
jgi:hypothetical protein